MQDNSNPALGSTPGSALEMAMGYLDAAARCLAKASREVADYTTFTALHADTARALARLEETAGYLLQDLEQVRDDLTE